MIFNELDKNIFGSAQQFKFHRNRHLEVMLKL